MVRKPAPSLPARRFGNAKASMNSSRVSLHFRGSGDGARLFAAIRIDIRPAWITRGPSGPNHAAAGARGKTH
jgi:hypothetical protein